MKEVLIIGGGPAGSMAARVLGNKATVYELRKPLQDKACAGGIAVHWLEKMNIKVPEGVIVGKVKGFEIATDIGHKFEFMGDELLGIVVDRGLFDTWLLENSGANIIRERFPRDIYKMKKEFKNYDYIIFADGFATSAYKLGFDTKVSPDDIHVCFQYYTNHRIGDKIRLIISDKYAPKGYVWEFPYKDGSEIGLGIPKSLGLNPKKLLDDYMKKYHPDVKIGGSRSGVVPTALPVSELVIDNMAVVGDAARLVNPATGGGIHTAMLSGMYVGMAILKGDIHKYTSYIRDQVMRNKMLFAIKELIYRKGEKYINDTLKNVQDFKLKGKEPDREIKRLIRYIMLRHPALGFEILRMVIKYAIKR